MGLSSCSNAARRPVANWPHGKGSAVFVAEYRALAHDHVGMLHWLAIAAEGHDNNLPALYSLPELLALP